MSAEPGGPHLVQASGARPRCAPVLDSPSLSFNFFFVLQRVEKGHQLPVRCLHRCKQMLF